MYQCSDPDPFGRGTDPRIRIRTKMSQIRFTGNYHIVILRKVACEKKILLRLCNCSKDKNVILDCVYNGWRQIHKNYTVFLLVSPVLWNKSVKKIYPVDPALSIWEYGSTFLRLNIHDLPLCYLTSVGDPWHFGADSDPNPRIRTSY